MIDRMKEDKARKELLILVDGMDRPVGAATKEQAHRQGLLHRAFSVVLIRKDDDGSKILISQRAKGKYHAAGLWANSCCSHPRLGEEPVEAVSRRLKEELGCQADHLVEIGAFLYRAEFQNGLIEYEYDHVFLGELRGELRPDTDEVENTRWVTPEELIRELTDAPGQFAPWAFTVFSMALERFST